MRFILIISFVFLSLDNPVITKDCIFVTKTGKQIPLHGKVRVVKNFGDIKVREVTAFPDLKIQRVNHFPDDCGEWEFVDNFEDFTIEYVSAFEDIQIQFVNSFPGL